MRICRIASVPFFLLHHLRHQIVSTAAAGHEVVLIASPGAEWSGLRGIDGVRAHEIPIARALSPLRDLASLLALWRCLRAERIDVLHSTTPKAGLLAAIAGRLAGVPVRLHTFTGQAWAELSGPMRWLARAADRVIVALNTRCYADSASQRAFLEEEGIAAPGDLAVLGPGSLAGVDAAVFDPDRYRDAAAELRRTHGIAPQARVLVFVGRVTRDKGIDELVQAFGALGERHPSAHLLLVGPEEPERDPLPAATRAAIAGDARIHAVGYSATPQHYLAAGDVLCLPSYREGFGNVVIEAAAMGLPAVGTRIVGLADAIADGETGILVPVRDAAALAAALDRLLADDALRLAMGRAARERALRLFEAGAVDALVLAEYTALAGARSA
jgi:glycosyltransferase involved in cell wall biosynthesis